ncbi:heparinase II/III family protein [Ovoidimarina sediminis]|uniref:heparinase II/III family protein n=1 Tax=Ovoidimarina sediminis TaxID=3079856 RepID=UPI00397769B9
MADEQGWRARAARGWNRTHAVMAGRGHRATAFKSQPEPRSIGSFARGRQLAAGNFLFAGYLVEAPGTSILDIPMPDKAFEMEVHGFEWLDHLAAAGDMASRVCAQDWTHDWARRFGKGKGPGWQPDLTGRRLVRWINHAVMLLNGQDRETSEIFFRVLSHQTNYLARRWKAAEPGQPRFEALGGLLHAALSLDGMERHIKPALRALSRECTQRIDDEGGLPSRNPEELLSVLILLTGLVEALQEAAIDTPEEIQRAIREIAPTLRILRHADGGLARFHGGGRGLDGRLDQALALSGVRHMRHKGLGMGFARLSQGRTTLIADAARPPSGEASLNGHASTLAFELTSGRRPLIVNCGAGETFGSTWRRAGRATPSHSTLSIEGYSSSRLGGQGIVAGRRTELLLDTPKDVTCSRPSTDRSAALVMSHDGYLRTHGLIHHRRLELAADGRSLIGDDSLSALTQDAERLFDIAFDRSGMRGVPFAIRFHLHPDVAAELDMGGTAVSMALKSGEIWIFRHDGTAQLSLAPSVYLERGRLNPRATKQIVLSAAAMDYGTRIGWTLAKAQDTPSHVRDLEVEDDLAASDR